ncbi:MAG: histidine kinase dimerization/phospho-acceptor domain-containing protein [Pseudomonadota bacterium]
MFGRPPRPLRFRTRATWWATLMAFAMSVLFALSAIYITEYYERIVVDGIMREVASDFVARHLKDRNASLPTEGRVRGFLQPHVALQPAAREAPGPAAAAIHGILRGDGVHRRVYPTPAGNLYLEVDLHGIVQLERQLLWILMSIIVLGTLVGASFGRIVARGVSGPLVRLADAVDTLPVQPQRTRLRGGLADDELGRLAHAIDRYQERLMEADEREQAFLADASHELRTPVAVVRGATELLVEDAADHPELEPRVKRLERGLAELSELLEALLRLAGRRHEEAVPVEEGRVWLEDVLARALRAHSPGGRVRIDGDPATLLMPRRDAELILRAVVRRLIAAGSGSAVVARMEPGGLVLHRHGYPPAEPHTGRPVARSDRGLGASLVGRLAQSHGWVIDESTLAEGIVRVTWNAASRR